MNNDKPLNYRQTLFAEYYAEGETQGNAYKSAIKAGYSHKFALQAAPRLLENVRIKNAIAERTAKIRAESVATRQQRQEFWTETYQDKTANMSDRLRASELLGKSEADFTDKHMNVGTDQPVQTPEEQAALKPAIKLFKEGLA